MDMYSHDSEAQPFDHANARALTIAIYRNIPLMRYITQAASHSYHMSDLPEFTAYALQMLPVRNVLAMVERASLDILTPYEHPYLLKSLVDVNILLRGLLGCETCLLSSHLFELEQSIIVEMALRFI
jgi:hypothetical protein